MKNAIGIQLLMKMETLLAIVIVTATSKTMEKSANGQKSEIKSAKSHAKSRHVEKMKKTAGASRAAILTSKGTVLATKFVTTMNAIMTATRMKTTKQSVIAIAM